MQSQDALLYVPDIVGRASAPDRLVGCLLLCQMIVPRMKRLVMVHVISSRCSVTAASLKT